MTSKMITKEEIGFALAKAVSSAMGSRGATLTADEAKIIEKCVSVMHPEITRLRAEVERLMNQYKYDGQHIQKAEDRIEELKRERDEALAHVAVLITEYLKLLPTKEQTTYTNSPLLLPTWVEAQARALLDRLQRAEAVVEAVRKRREFFEQEYGWICRGSQPWSAGVSEQDRIEFEALAAWEDGK